MTTRPANDFMLSVSPPQGMGMRSATSLDRHMATHNNVISPLSESHRDVVLHDLQDNPPERRHRRGHRSPSLRVSDRRESLSPERGFPDTKRQPLNLPDINEVFVACSCLALLKPLTRT